MKNVLITGATGGIGSAILDIFYKNEFNIIASGTNEDKLKKLQDKYSERVSTIKCDLSDENQININRESNPCRGCPAPYYRCVAAAQHDRFPARWSRIDSKAQGSLGCDSPWRLLMVRIPRSRYFVCVFSIFSIHTTHNQHSCIYSHVLNSHAWQS